MISLSKLNTATDGFERTAPARSFEPNPLGLYNMAGNVWEWVHDAFRVRSLSRTARDRNAHARAHGDRVLKGGSFLCHVSYCSLPPAWASASTAPAATAASESPSTEGAEGHSCGQAARLNYLVNLSIKLKIDRSFVARLEDHRSATLVEGIVSLGHRLGKRIVAEGGRRRPSKCTFGNGLR